MGKWSGIGSGSGVIEGQEVEWYYRVRKWSGIEWGSGVV